MQNISNFLVILIFGVQVFASQISDISQCEKNSDCIIVPYSHCCGSTKKAIHKKFLKDYEKYPTWQKFDNPTACATIGLCAPDTDMKKTKCVAGLCQLAK